MVMDSARPMFGEKSGLEVCICEPHLLNNDMDSYHHMHNVIKNFTSYCGSFLERLLRDLYTDFKHSTDSLESSKDLKLHLNLTFQKPSD